MNFWIEFSLILLLCYAYYQLILAKQPHFQFNRLFLMTMVPLSALLAYLSIPLRGTPEIISVINLAEINIDGLGEGLNAETAFSWWYVYFAGVLMSASITASRLVRLWRFIQRHPQQKEGPFVLIHCGLKDSPASFFRYIFWNEQISQNAEERAQILAHEKCHVRQRHTMDRLIVELMLILCWFHPLVYLIRRDLLQTHEFLADRAATQDGNIRNYASLLLSRAFGTRLHLSHSFFHSPVKNRIMMLQRSVKRTTSLRYLGVLPLLALMVILFACQPEANHPELSQPELRQPEEVIGEAEQEFPPIEGYLPVDEEPKPINLNELYKEIGYPQIARDASIEGMVVARIMIDEEGQYLEHEIIQEAHVILSIAVEKQLPKLKMTPALKDGVPVKYWVNIPFNFKLID